MTTWMLLLLIVIISQRLLELVIAKSNEIWMKNRGGIEYGADHHKWFVIVHFCFFVSLIIESTMTSHISTNLNYVLLFLFILTQLARVWCIASLGRFWNTRIIIMPRGTLVSSGPYKYLKHPNYIIVGIEFIVIPLLYGAYITAVIFPILHYMLLRVRIPEENAALRRAMIN